MKKIISGFLCAFLISCSGVATTSTTKTESSTETLIGGFGGTNIGGFGGNLVSGGQGGNSSSTTTSSSEPKEVILPTYNDCAKTIVFAPPSELSGNLEVTCFTPTKDTIVSGYSYTLFATDPGIEYYSFCSKALHKSIWFKVEANPNYEIIGDPVIYTYTDQSSSFEWVSKVVDGAVGSITEIVTDIQDQLITPNDMFCFGHLATGSFGSDLVTCNVACITDDSDVNHQISLQATSPYDWVHLGDVSEFFPGEKLQFISYLITLE